MSDTFPRRFGSYVLVEPLGQGGMGQVALALSGQADKPKLCVIKRMLSEVALNPQSRARFDHEAAIALQLSHRNLAPTFASGTVDGEPFLAQEFVEGRNVAEVQTRLAERFQILPVELGIYIARQLGRALEYVHGLNGLQLVHRDVTPTNVRVTYDGEVKLMDFGAAASSHRMFRTEPGGHLGKLVFMAPEQFGGSAPDARSDIYALGVVLWELLTNRPFGTEDLDGRRVLAGGGSWMAGPPENWTPPRPSELNALVPADLDAVVAKALARFPAGRYQRADELAAGLSALLPPRYAGDIELAQYLKQLFPNDKERAHRRDASRAAARLLPGDGLAGGTAPATQPTAKVAPTSGSSQRGRHAIWAAGGVVVLLGLGSFAALLRERPVPSPETSRPASSGSSLPRVADVFDPARAPRGMEEPPSIASPLPPAAEASADQVAPPARKVPFRRHEKRAAPTTSPTAPEQENRSAELLDGGRRAFALGRYDEAFELATAALRLEAGAEAHVLIGNVRLKERRLDEAEAAFEAALKLHPDHQVARTRLERIRGVREQSNAGAMKRP